MNERSAERTNLQSTDTHGAFKNVIASFINYFLQPSEVQVITLLKCSDLIYPYVRETKGELYLFFNSFNGLFVQCDSVISVSSVSSPFLFQLLK